MALVLLLAACGGGEAPRRTEVQRPRPTARPSVVLVNVSGARQDALAAPAFTAFLPDAATFTQATTAAPWEAPALATVLTGMIPYDTNVKGRAGIDRPYLIPPIVTMAEMLRDEGYATGAVVTGTHVARPLGLDQGFDAWTEGLALDAAPAAAGSWLAARQPPSAPFFLFVHLDATRPPPPDGVADLAAWAATSYDERMAQAGAALAALRKVLDGASLPADTITILLSDHGEPRTLPREGTLRGAGVTDDQIRVPLAIRGPGFPRATVAASCGLVDLLPTVRDAMGLPPATGLGGRSLLPLVRAPASEGAPIVVQAWRRRSTSTGPTDETLYAVRTARAKFVAVFTPRPPGWTEAVYDLERDPAEAAPLAGTEAARFGADFAKAVENVRDLLRGRRSHLQDPIVAGYVAGGG